MNSIYSIQLIFTLASNTIKEYLQDIKINNRCIQIDDEGFKSLCLHLPKVESLRHISLNFYEYFSINCKGGFLFTE